MTTDNAAVIPPDLTIAGAWQRAQADEQPVYLVGAPPRLVGTVLRSDLDSLHLTDQADAPVATIAQESFVHAHPDHTIDIVLERLEESGGLLPVVSRTDAHRLEGVITPESLTRRRRRPAERAESQRAS
jgi:CBS domain-containing protein